MTDGAHHHVSPSERRLISITVALATIVIILDMNIAGIALPHMQGSLSASQDQIIWVMTAFFVAQALMTACGGWLAGMLGRKRLYMIALIGYSVCSLLAAQSSSLGELVLFRAMPGAFGAPIVPLSQAVLLDIYPREKHGIALSVWGMGVTVAPVMGPVLGGWLTDAYSWRAIYFIGAPFAVLACVGVWAFFPGGERDSRRPLDWKGFGFLAIGLAALQLVLDRGQIKGWFDSSEIVIAASFAAFGFYAFVVHSMTTDRPFLSPALFADRNFVLGVIFVFLVGAIVFSSNVIMPLFLQNLAGYPVQTAGLLMAPRGVGTLIALFVAGRLVNRIDPRILTAAGFVAVALSSWELSVMNLEVEAWHFILASIGNGMGIGLVWVPLTTLAFATLAPHLRNEAANLWSLVRIYGSAVGISLLNNLQITTRTETRARLVDHVNPFNSILTAPDVPSQWDPATTTGLAALAREIDRQSSMIGYLADFNLMLMMSVAMLPFLIWLRIGARPAR
ncbi:MAG: DHA2 family efflux MFS transporter permease subunit [Rhodospirillaceae bacterium]